MMKPEVDWVSVDKEPTPPYRGFYYISFPVNPIEGCASAIQYFDGENWLFPEGKKMPKKANDEIVAWAKVDLPANDFALDWKSKFPEMFK